MDSEPCRVIGQRALSQGSLKDKGWKQITTCTRKKVSPPPWNMTSGTGTFCSRCGALEPEGQTADEMGEGPSGTPPGPHIKTSFVKGKRGVVVTGDSLLRGPEDPIHRLDPTHRESSVSQGHGSGR